MTPIDVAGSVRDRRRRAVAPRPRDARHDRRRRETGSRRVHRAARLAAASTVAFTDDTATVAGGTAVSGSRYAVKVESLRRLRDDHPDVEVVTHLERRGERRDARTSTSRSASCRRRRDDRVADAVIETERLTLRRFGDDDRDTVARWNADPDFTRHLAGVQTRAQSDEVFDRWERHWDEHGFGLLAVEWRETGELIGRVGPAVPPHVAGRPGGRLGARSGVVGARDRDRGRRGRASRGRFGELGFARLVSITTEAERRLAQRDGEARLRAARAGPERVGKPLGARARPVAWNASVGKRERSHIEVGAEPLARARARLRRAVHGRARRDDRERRAAVDPERARTSALRPAVDRQRATRSSSAASCCSAAAPPTCSGGSGSSSPASSSSPSPRCQRHRDSSGVLIAGRALQGLGGALVSPAALSIVTTTFDEGASARRRSASGARSPRAAARSACPRRRPHRVRSRGAGSSSSTCRSASPRRCSSLRFVPNSRAEERPETVRRRRRGHRHRRPARARLRDREGAGLRLGRPGKTLGLVRASRSRCSPRSSSIEQRSKAPLIRLGIFRMRSLTGSNAAMLLVASGLFAMFYFASLYLQQILGYGPLKAGFAFLPFTFGIVIGAGALAGADQPARHSHRDVHRHRARRRSGCSTSRGSRRTAPTSCDLLPTIVIISIGMGLTFVPLTLLATTNVAARATPGSRRASSTPRSRSAARSASPSSRRSRHLARATC